mmetsp:Transcript_30181/g.86601  ORF Transcript_30181/g.86601 Transcript_30181/m.86601 type:complete len:350 (+) Transcript_30181:33-1082(+)
MGGRIPSCCAALPLAWIRHDVDRKAGSKRRNGNTSAEMPHAQATEPAQQQAWSLRSSGSENNVSRCMRRNDWRGLVGHAAALDDTIGANDRDRARGGLLAVLPPARDREPLLAADRVVGAARQVEVDAHLAALANAEDRPLLGRGNGVAPATAQEPAVLATFLAAPGQGRRQRLRALERAERVDAADLAGLHEGLGPELTVHPLHGAPHPGLLLQPALHVVARGKLPAAGEEEGCATVEVEGDTVHGQRRTVQHAPPDGPELCSLLTGDAPAAAEAPQVVQGWRARRLRARLGERRAAPIPFQVLELSSGIRSQRCLVLKEHLIQAGVERCHGAGRVNRPAGNRELPAA